MELTLLRHASPHEEYHGCYNGHTDIPIDPSLLDSIKIAPIKNSHFDHIYSSDLCRCTATLEQIGFHRYNIDPRLREVRFKSHIEGKSFAQIERMEDYSPSLLDSWETWHDFICAESKESFTYRIESFLNDLPQDGNILLCTHAGTIQKILSFLSPINTVKALNYLEYTKVRVK